METSLVRLSIFYGAAHTAGQLLSLVKLAPLLGHLVVGVLLGPPLAGLAPATTDLALAGLVGVWLSVLDAGLATDHGAARAAAVRGTAIAVVGIVMPVAGAAAVVYARAALKDGGGAGGGATARAAAAAGAAIAPTSLGVVASLLAEHGEMETELGRLVAVAAVVDDLLSLILLGEIKALAAAAETDRGGRSGRVWALSRPLVFAVAVVAGLVVFARALPAMLRGAERVVPPVLRPRACLAALLGLATLFTWASAKAGTSFLLPAYMTGIAFSAARGTQWAMDDRWRRGVAPLIPSMLLLFFAATIGFAIPLSALLSRGAVGVGAALGFIGVVSKLLCGLLAPNIRRDGLAVGVAMLGRGEFGFIIATESARLELLDKDLYGAVIWGVLIPTILAPVLFGWVYRARKSKLNDEASAPSAASDTVRPDQRDAEEGTSVPVPSTEPPSSHAPRAAAAIRHWQTSPRALVHALWQPRCSPTAAQAPP